MKLLEDLAKDEYQALVNIGMMWEFYPEATGDWVKDTKQEEPLEDGYEWRLNSGRMKDGVFIESYNFKLEADNVCVDDFIQAMSLIYLTLGFKNKMEVHYTNPNGGVFIDILSN
jgi:hypothetical protein